MNKTKRLEYRCLNDLEDDLPAGMNVGLFLCVWCRYNVWAGCGCESWPECHHSLDAVRDLTDNIDPEVYHGGDCWGFRPKYVYEDIVDAVGLYLQGKYPDFDTLRKIGN